MTAHERLTKAADTLNNALGIELILDVLRSLQGHVYNVHLSKRWFFSVDYEEIVRNSVQGLVNLLKIKLEYTLSNMLGNVTNLGTYVHIVRGTQPWVLIQGL